MAEYEMSVEEYLKNPALCPYCGCNDVESSGAEPIDLKTVGDEVTCNRCHAVWQDIYTLSNIVELELPDNEDMTDDELVRDGFLPPK